MSPLTISQITMLILASVALVAHAQTDSNQPAGTTDSDVRLPPSITGGPLGDEITLLHYFETDEDIELLCAATGVPEPNIEWYKNDENVDLNIQNVAMTEEGSLIIRSMTSLDEGVYHCTASNINGKAMSIGAELVKATLGRYPPSMEQKYTGDEGDYMMIPCLEVKSVPDATYNWALAESEDDEAPKTLTTNERLVLSPKGYLYFSNLRREDARNGWLYKCNVFNPTLDITVGGSYAKIEVNLVTNVQDKAPVLRFPEANDNKVIAVLGESFELKCIFSGRPAPRVTWKKVGGSLPGGRFDDQEDDGTLLRITDVQWKDEAEYVCTGSNSLGSKTFTISVDVQSKPTFVNDPERQMNNANVTQGQKAKFFCEADPLTEPSPQIDFMINAVALDDDNEYPGPRKSITKIEGKPGKMLAIENVCKDCIGGGTDLMGIQCRIVNDHGTIFKSVYLNILLPVAITKSPQDVELNEEVIETGEVKFECAGAADDSTPVLIRWFRDDKVIYADRDERLSIDDQNTLHIDIADLDDKGEQFAGIYTCKASNGYSNAEVEAALTTPDGAGVAPVASAGVFDMWWIFIIIALILLLLILLLCCCLCIQRNKGDTYPVDEKERANGNDPEKELADSGFHDYQRPEDEPVKGSRASLTSTIKLDSDDEGSLNEYGDIDTGKFNEDGSFIGQYMNDKKKKKAFDSTV